MIRNTCRVADGDGATGWQHKGEVTSEWEGVDPALSLVRVSGRA